MQLHENEYAIDDDLVTRLLVSQMPDLAGLSLSRFDSSGTVNAVYRLGEDLLIHLPRAPAFVTGPRQFGSFACQPVGAGCTFEGTVLDNDEESQTCNR